MNRFVVHIILSLFAFAQAPLLSAQPNSELQIVQEWFRLRNEQKADSVEQYFADTVKVYMKYLRNVPRQTITKLDREFFKRHPRNRFEIIKPITIRSANGIVTAIIIGKEYLDGVSFKYERIEIRFNRARRIEYVRAANIKNPG